MAARLPMRVVMQAVACWALIAAVQADEAGERAALTGRWKIVSVAYNGVAAADEAGGEFVFDEQALREVEGTDRAKYRLNVATNPKQLDIALDSDDPELTIRAIYKLDGDELTIGIIANQSSDFTCGFGGPTSPRPANFQPSKWDELVVLTLKRAPPPAH